MRKLVNKFKLCSLYAIACLIASVLEFSVIFGIGYIITSIAFLEFVSINSPMDFVILRFAFTLYFVKTLFDNRKLIKACEVVIADAK